MTTETAKTCTSNIPELEVGFELSSHLQEIALAENNLKEYPLFDQEERGTRLLKKKPVVGTAEFESQLYQELVKNASGDPQRANELFLLAVAMGRENAPLRRFILEYGMRSRYFLPWLAESYSFPISVPKNSACESAASAKANATNSKSNSKSGAIGTKSSVASVASAKSSVKSSVKPGIASAKPSAKSAATDPAPQVRAAAQAARAAITQLPRKINQAKACLAGFGFAPNFHGKLEQIPADDPFYEWVIREPVFVWQRTRAILTAQELRRGEKRVCYQMQKRGYRRGDEDFNVLFLGGGYVPEIGMTGVEIAPTTMVRSVDGNAQIRLPEGWHNPLVEPRRVSALTADILRYAATRRSDAPRYDLIVINGVVPYLYQVWPNMLSGILTNLLRQEGGVITFDVLFRHWALCRTQQLFRWGSNLPCQLFNGWQDLAEGLQPTLGLLRNRRSLNCAIEIRTSIDGYETAGSKAQITDPVGAQIFLRFGTAVDNSNAFDSVDDDDVDRSAANNHHNNNHHDTDNHNVVSGQTKP